ncbi:MAG TPA: ABC transporter substrate-binding protein [Candidatus Mediterraneibacter tabaqchaliae]|uniref:ABC transporter substrate-binding protein n=1 Tax=Candidatus Mediterraneibacter tabaqchaliae TaxID=2838689 RepID=A0A9D2U0X4_9FIRM|nr:ABC transporter substrate-binding protein [Candidatus Mediterraneibacter tabaqchaliae]
MRKKVIAGFMAALMAASLVTGCGSGGSDGGDGGSSGVTEIVFWHPMGGVQQTALDNIVNEFNETVGAEKGIKVTTVYQGANTELAKKLKAAVQAKDMDGLPDITTMSSGETGYMKDLDLAVKAQQIFDIGSIGLSADDFQEGMLNSLAYEGEAVGLPFSSSAILFYYNKDAFREAGLDPEKAPQTIEELGEYSKQLTKTEGSEIAQYGFGYAADSWVVASWVGQQDTDGQGYSLFGDNNNGHDGVMTKVVFDENGTMKHFLEVYKAAAETGNFKYKEDDPVNNLSAGNITMTLASSASLTTVMDSVGDKFELGVAALPRVDENATGSVTFGGNAVYPIDKGNEDKLNATYEFLKYFYTDEAQLEWHSGTGYLPVTNSTYESDAYAQFIAENPQFAVAADCVAESDPNVQEAMCGVAGTILTIVKDGIMNCLDGSLTVDEAVQTMAEESNTAIQDYNDANY